MMCHRQVLFPPMINTAPWMRSNSNHHSGHHCPSFAYLRLKTALAFFGSMIMNNITSRKPHMTAAQCRLRNFLPPRPQGIASSQYISCG